VDAIPLIDFKLQHRQIADEIEAAIARVIDSAWFILGPEVEAFERAFAAFSGVAHCIGVGNGTDALELVVRALDVGPGDEVIVPANSFIASALAVTRAGATPVLVDCDPVHHLMDPVEVARRTTPRTRAVMPVHLYGQCAPVEAIRDAAGARVAIIEDAAQSQGAKRHGTTAGGLGVAAGTSFYPGKNLGAYGDAGGVLTTSAELAQKIRALRNYGSEVKYHHPEVGFNSRLDPVQAAILSVKLAHLAQGNEARRQAAARYDELLAGVPLVTPPRTLDGNESVVHLYVVRVPRRDEVLKKLHAAGIGAAIHYPVPIHLQGAYAHLGHGPGAFPNAERAAAEILSLPLYPGITPAQQERVVDELRRAVG
jgi:dTDP-4-amino-4,6-dideoxygalactose transaminase